MPDNIDRYLPEFDEESQRERLQGLSREDLMDMLLRAYKQTRLMAKVADEAESKLARIVKIVEEPSPMLTMPDIPGPDDLKRMTE